LNGSVGLIAGVGADLKYIDGRSALYGGLNAWSALPDGAPAQRAIPYTFSMGANLVVWGGLRALDPEEPYLRDGKILVRAR
jgi:hypothetical protein